MTNKSEKRPNIPSTIQLKLWIEAGGRCSFPSCNKILYHDGLTLKPGNYSNIAHIISWKPTGPRGDKELSPKLGKDISNLMLMCRDHAHLIDRKNYIEEYSVDVLKEYKHRQEHRIRVQTELYGGKTHIISFKSKIGERIVSISANEVMNAIKPYFPDVVPQDWTTIEIPDFERINPPTYWQSTVEFIERRIKSLKNRGGKHLPEHLSIFAIGSMPLLIALGKFIGDTIPTNIFQRKRVLNNSDDAWCWDETSSNLIEFREKTIKYSKSKNVALILSLSDTITEDKFLGSFPNNSSIYEISIENPTPHFLTKKVDLENFSKIYRRRLNEIQKNHGKNCVIHLLPAIPVSIAIECGRVLLPTKDPDLLIYEYYSNEGKFKEVVRL